MKFIESDYIIEEDFECEEFLNRNYLNLIKYSQGKMMEGFLDMGMINTPLNVFFSPKINKVIHDLFIVDNTTSDILFNLYIQQNSLNKGNYHNHIHLKASICGVFYTKIPKEGGEFSIIHPPTFTYEKPLIIKPQINKIYLFPSWLYHRPLPQKDETPRICININYLSLHRPIVKGYNIMW